VESGSHEELLIVEEDDVAWVEELSRCHGVGCVTLPVAGIEPVTTVTLLVIGSVAAVATVSRLIDQHKGGQVIDLRPGSPRPFYRSKDVVYGLVVVLAVDGTVTVEVRKPKDMFSEVLEALSKIATDLVGKSVEAVSSSVKAAVGKDVSIATERLPPR
jgi:hypothetical protein